MSRTTSALLVTTALAWSSAAVASIDLQPVADTYIQSGTHATLDHGGASGLEVDASPSDVTYLKFDLSGVTEPVERVVLVLSVTNSSRDGGTVYRIPYTSWLEGSGKGTTGSGLTWAEVDRNADGRLDALDLSPLVPDPRLAVVSLGAVASGQLLELDVTAAFRDGPALYTLAIMSGSSDGTTFRSREATTGGPLLRLSTPDTPPPPPTGPVCGDGVVDAGEACDRGADTACPGLCRSDCTCGTPIATASCLDQAGPLLTLSGTWATRYSNRSLLAGTRIDARSAVFLGSPTNFYPFSVAGGPAICVAGGDVRGQYDRSLSWQQMHDLNNAGVAFTNPATVVEGARIDNVTDALRPRGGAEGFVIRGVRLSYVRDDCVENDSLHGGLVTDSLFDGCYVAFSARPGSSNTTSDGRNAVWRIESSLVRLAPMPGARPGSVAYPDGWGHGPFFKWDKWDDPANSRSPKIVLRNNVFRADRITQEGARRMGIPPQQLLDCADNVMVWLGPGSYPAPLPSCFTITKDASVWDDAVAAWTARHASR
jgi:hypothetical protein